MQLRIVVFLSALCMVIPAQGQKQTAAALPAGQPLQQLVQAQFGDTFVVDANFPAMAGDLDGDGAPDLIVVARSKNPLGSEADRQYKVIDPYDAYFGFGNPKLMSRFSELGDGDGKARCLLIIHGYQLATAKAKFVVVNLPFDHVNMSKASAKKKTVDAIGTSEVGGFNSVVFFDGKKYRWEPLGFSDDLPELDQGGSAGLSSKSQ